jgi:SAM-dependent methyltransferase
MIRRTLRAAWNHARWYVHRLQRGGQACRSYAEFRLTEFDRSYGTETSALLPVEELGDDLPNRDAACFYSASHPVVFRDLVRAAGVEPRKFTFVDLGSGKGRVLVLAAEAGFRSVVGVEFSPTLHRVAVANLAVYHRRRGAAQSTQAVTAVCQDVAAYAFPPGPLVAFFFNSFRGGVLDSVLANLAKTAATAAADPVFLLWNGVHWYADIRTTIEACPHLTLLADQNDCRVYRVQPPG